MGRRVFLSVGDISAANYMAEIFKDAPEDIEVLGITEKKMKSVGIKSVGDVSELAVVGISEVVPKLMSIRRLYKKVLESLRECDVLIACDAPGFNLRLIKDAKKLGVKRVIYFISPQVWAWKAGRAKVIAEFSDHLIVILPFEVDIYKAYEGKDFKVHYVGHPLVDMVRPTLPEDEFLRRAKIEGDFLTLMPGSRWSEVKKHTPYLRKVAEMLLRDRDISFVVPTFPLFREFIEKGFSNLPVRVLTEKEIESPAYNSLYHSKFALIASGTSSLESALLSTPHGVFYRVSPITYLIGRILVRVPYISLPNLILQRKVVEEFINRSPYELYVHTKDMLRSEEKLKAMKESFSTLRDLLGGSGVLERLRSLFFELIG